MKTKMKTENTNTRNKTHGQKREELELRLKEVESRIEEVKSKIVQDLNPLNLLKSNNKSKSATSAANTIALGLAGRIPNPVVNLAAPFLINQTFRLLEKSELKRKGLKNVGKFFSWLTKKTHLSDEEKQALIMSKITSEQDKADYQLEKSNKKRKEIP